METKLWYKKPAASFAQALPIGNGSLGAMVYGRLPEERISLNLDTLWSGYKQEEIEEKSPKILQRVRKLIKQNALYEAQNIIEEELLGHYNESYMPLGNLRYRFLDIDEGSIVNYRRELDLDTAVHTSSFNTGAKTVNSRVFASCPDNMIILEICSSAAQGLNLELWMDSLLEYRLEKADDHSLYLHGTAPSHVVPNYIECDNPVIYEEANPGMLFGCMVTLEIQNGQIAWYGDRLRIEKADCVRAYLTAADDFEGYDKPLHGNPDRIKQACRNCIETVTEGGYETAKKRHIQDYQTLFHRVSFHLAGSIPEGSTDERLLGLKRLGMDPDFYSLYFQYGRYLMIAASREGTQPANLQGIWSESIRPVWSSNLTVNINTQMNYWMTGVCNLLECEEPLWRLVRELSESGRKTARKQFGCGGWVCCHNVDIWRQTTPVGGCAKYAYWPMGGIWLTVQLFEYYKYTQDPDFLKELCQVMEGACRFCLDWLVRGEDGQYHTAPSTSPENSFWDDMGRECYVSYSSAMDISLITELFTDMLEAGGILQTEGGLYTDIAGRLAHLAGLRVNREGILNEWQEEYREVDPGHRHFSPLVSFHMGSLINRTRTPELSAACEQFLDRKIEHGCGHIGWSCAWLVSLYAKLGRQEDAFCNLRQLICNSSYDNLMDLHPPLGENSGEREVFQIDGNYGGTYGIAAMLLGQYGDVIELLPALPKEWPEGNIQGLLACGGFTCSIWWSGGRLEKACIRARKKGKLKVRYRHSFFLEPDLYSVGDESGNAIEKEMAAGQECWLYPVQ